MVEGKCKRNGVDGLKKDGESFSVAFSAPASKSAATWMVGWKSVRWLRGPAVTRTRLPGSGWAEVEGWGNIANPADGNLARDDGQLVNFSAPIMNSS